jgi:S1-C subfamily serine protease
MVLSLLSACAYSEPPPWSAVTFRQGSLAIPREEGSSSVGTSPSLGERGLVRSGTGFFVTHGGVLLTSAHVVAGCPAISVWRDGQPANRTRLMAIDPRHDLALVTSDLAPPQIAAAPTGRPLSIGERVFLLGFGVRETQPPAPVLIHGTFAGYAATPNGAKAFVIRAEVPRGASGGLVIDRSGGLLGMIVGYDTDSPDLGIVVANSEIENFLAANGVRLNKLSAPARRPPAVERLIQGVSALVQCTPRLGP